MLYVLEAFNREDEQKTRIVWETSKTFDGTPEICDKLLCFMRIGAKKYKIPEGVTTLCSETFVDSEGDWFDCDAVSLELPASLKKIEDNAFLFADFKSIRVAPGNTSFIVKKDGLYTADGKRLIYILAKDGNQEFQVAEGTELIDAGVFHRNGPIRIPTSVKRFGNARIFCGPDLKLIAPKGSCAERFAQRMGFDFEPIDI